MSLSPPVLTSGPPPRAIPAHLTKLTRSATLSSVTLKLPPPPAPPVHVESERPASVNGAIDKAALPPPPTETRYRTTTRSLPHLSACRYWHHQYKSACPPAALRVEL